MSQVNDSPAELQSIYAERFGGHESYRMAVWAVLCRDFFQRWVPVDGAVLDLGCGYGEFIRQIRAARKFGMDLNPESARALGPGITLLAQDCSQAWGLPDASLDVVFTSNFFEHLPDKAALGRTLDQARRCLKPGGRIVAMGPNIKYLPGAYWDFWDHYLPLTELSLAEGLRTRGFTPELTEPRFLPYTMVGGPKYPLAFLKAYLAIRPAWRWFGHQFLVVGRKN